MASPFSKEWDAVKGEPLPSEVRNIVFMAYREFQANVWAGKARFAREFVHSTLGGDAWILKGAFASNFMRTMRKKVIAWCAERPSEFHKMLDGSPDFHRVIDESVSALYSIKAGKHSAYFYRWNDDPLDLWPTVTSRWRVVKRAMGLASTAYEANLPSDGVVDRIQVVRYPPAIGFLEPHVDAHEHQRFFFSGYMSKRGVDYEGGGFYFLRGEEKVEIEDRLEVGDVCIGYASLKHGVAPCDLHKTPSWEAHDGRWFLSMYSNASDAMKDRATAKALA